MITAIAAILCAVHVVAWLISPGSPRWETASPVSHEIALEGVLETSPA